MKLKSVFFLFIVLLFTISHRTEADLKTKVLQNGLDGYDGCQDTYIRIRGVEPQITDSMTNYEGEDSFIISN